MNSGRNLPRKLRLLKGWVLGRIVKVQVPQLGLYRMDFDGFSGGSTVKGCSISGKSLVQIGLLTGPELVKIVFTRFKRS